MPVYDDGGMEIPVRGSLRREFVFPAPSSEQVADQRNSPVRIACDIWLYHDYWVKVEDADTYREDEVIMLVKHVVLRDERELGRFGQEVETLERVEDLPETTRATIPDDVRMFV